MPRWTPEDLKAYELRQAGAARLRPSEPERDPGMPLVSPPSGEAEGAVRVEHRYRITFTIYRVRPLDWDNHFVKPLQDCCVLAHFIPDDSPDVLEGSVLSKKAKTKAEERTEIVIEQIDHNEQA